MTVFPGFNQYWLNDFFLWIYVHEHPKAQPAVVLVLKRLRRRGDSLKVSSNRLGEAGNRTCDPLFTRHRFIPYTTLTLHLVGFTTKCRKTTTKARKLITDLYEIHRLCLFVSKMETKHISIWLPSS